ncbi:MAG: hypothetical protein CMO26_02160 [Thiotrichales bacterium]|nr:hypothetical protein [Thiotrichales bacterium]|tara:strand:- start:518 stop:739 length:222 start_codon:yes stop_codon:yes gene_type:complete
MFMQSVVLPLTLDGCRSGLLDFRCGADRFWSDEQASTPAGFDARVKRNCSVDTFLDVTTLSADLNRFLASFDP